MIHLGKLRPVLVAVMPPDCKCSAVDSNVPYSTEPGNSIDVPQIEECLNQPVAELHVDGSLLAQAEYGPLSVCARTMPGHASMLYHYHPVDIFVYTSCTVLALLHFSSFLVSSAYLPVLNSSLASTTESLCILEKDCYEQVD